MTDGPLSMRDELHLAGDYYVDMDLQAHDIDFSLEKDSVLRVYACSLNLFANALRFDLIVSRSKPIVSESVSIMHHISTSTATLISSLR